MKWEFSKFFNPEKDSDSIILKSPTLQNFSVNSNMLSLVEMASICFLATASAFAQSSITSGKLEIKLSEVAHELFSVLMAPSVFPYPHLSSFFFAVCLQFKNSASVHGCLWLFLGPHLIVKSLTKNFFPDKHNILSKRNSSQKFIFFFYFGDCSYCFALDFAFEAGAHYIDLAVLEQTLQTVLALNSRRCPCPCPCPYLCLLWDKPSVPCEYMLLSLVDNKGFFGL